MAEILLNEGQASAVNNQKWPLLVVAGAGTGKTRVIVEKINQLLNNGVQAERILALTFTEKAAAEMLDRVLERRGGYELEMPILTFNAYGDTILREFAADSNLGVHFTLLGDSAKIVFLSQQFEALQLDYFAPISNPEAHIPQLADYFSKLKQFVISPESYIEFVSHMPTNDDAEQLEKKKHAELANAYKQYILLCESKQVIDYDDQIYAVIRLLQNRPNVLKQLQEHYHTILVDEFQDTNPMQSALISLLTTDQTELMVVGDDDQSIYGFRGATLANILDFKTKYPESNQVTLTENYRSSQAILDASYRLIQNNNPHRLEASLSIDKRLRSAKKSSLEPQLHCFASLSQEMQWLADDIQKAIDTGVEAGEIAVLCRRNKTAQYVSEALELNNIDHVVIGEKYQLYKTKIVRTLTEALKTVVDPLASVSLYHTLTSELFQVAPHDLSTYASEAKKTHQSLESYLHSNTEPGTVIHDAVQHIMTWRTHSGTLTVGKLLYEILESSGLKDRLYTAALNNDEAGLTIMQLSQYFRTIQEFEQIAMQPSAVQYIESLPVLAAAGQTDEDGTLELSNTKVNILTIHKAKGLEWDNVYIPDCTEGSFPMRKMTEGLAVPNALTEAWHSDADDHIAEERRLMYVAATRARSNLTMTYAEKHYTPTPRKPSRFLSELFEQLPRQYAPEGQQELALTMPLIGEASTKSIQLPSSMQLRDTIRLSVSQITNFLNCPLDFYYRYILNVPAPQSHAATYGSAIHTVIETFNKSRLNNEPVTVDTLLRVLDQEWKAEGYLSKDHEQKARLQARSTVKNFYETHNSEAPPTLVEWPFSVKFENEKLTITGRLDAVFQTKDATEIRDYKTSSSVNTAEKAKSRATSSDQLTLYALIWQEQHGILPTNLSLEFVDTGIIGSVRKTERGVQTMRSKISAVAEAIRTNNFKPGNSHDFCLHPPLE